MTKTLSDYTDAELKILSDQVKAEILVREDRARQQWKAKVYSPAYNPLKAFYQRWPGFSRLGKPDYAEFMLDVADWSTQRGIDLDVDGGVSKMVAELENNYYEFDNFVDSPE